MKPSFAPSSKASALYREKVLDILFRVDPHWDKVEFGNEWIYKTEPFVKASKDARLLFLGTEWQDTLVLAGSYPQQPVASLLKNQYKHSKLPIRQ